MDTQSVGLLLENTTSGVDNVRKPAETTLSNLETTPGFCSVLLQIITNVDGINSQLRLLAAITLKNVVKNQWRRVSRAGMSNRNPNAATKGIQDHEKDHLRKALLTPTIINQESKAIAIQVFRFFNL